MFIIKKAKIKEMLLQLGKRKADEDRYKSMMIHPKTIRSEKAQLEERMQMNQYCMEHNKVN